MYYNKIKEIFGRENALKLFAKKKSKSKKSGKKSARRK
jgi:hypothetical protein